VGGRPVLIVGLDGLTKGLLRPTFNTIALGPLTYCYHNDNTSSASCTLPLASIYCRDQDHWDIDSHFHIRRMIKNL
jgi:hypothetical protein